MAVSIVFLCENAVESIQIFELWKELGKTCANYTFQPFFCPLKTKKLSLYI